MPVFGLEMYIDVGLPKGVLPRTAVERGGPSLLWRGEKRLWQGHGQEAWYAIVVARVVL